MSKLYKKRSLKQNFTKNRHYIQKISSWKIKDFNFLFFDL